MTLLESLVSIIYGNSFTISVYEAVILFKQKHIFVQKAIYTVNMRSLYCLNASNNNNEIMVANSFVLCDWNKLFCFSESVSANKFFFQLRKL